jgi:fluoroacetyl-CoA thioesterase
MAQIPIGTTGTSQRLVTSDIAIDFLGTDSARVLATPHLIGLLEFTCRDSILPLLEPGFDSVGTDVSVKHLAAAPMGMQVRFLSEVIAVNDRRVTFKVEAYDEKEKISEGTHERFIINIARFATRLQAKLADK